MKNAAYRYLLLLLVLSLLPRFAFALGDITAQFSKVLLYGLLLIIILVIWVTGGFSKKK